MIRALPRSALVPALLVFLGSRHDVPAPGGLESRIVRVSLVQEAVARDVSAPLLPGQQKAPSNLPSASDAGKGEGRKNALPSAGSSVEQTTQGTRPPAEIVANFDCLGEGFEGPQGAARFRNPSDNSLAVGPDHIVQIVNSRMAVFTKKGTKFAKTGVVLYGPVPTH